MHESNCTCVCDTFVCESQWCFTLMKKGAVGGIIPERGRGWGCWRRSRECETGKRGLYSARLALALGFMGLKTSTLFKDALEKTIHYLFINVASHRYESRSSICPQLLVCLGTFCVRGSAYIKQCRNKRLLQRSCCSGSNLKQMILICKKRKDSFIQNLLVLLILQIFGRQQVHKTTQHLCTVHISQGHLNA